jgi:hypothetical protein
MKFEIHFEFRASLRKFQDLNFWDATESTALPSENWKINLKVWNFIMWKEIETRQPMHCPS